MAAAIPRHIYSPGRLSITRVNDGRKLSAVPPNLSNLERRDTFRPEDSDEERDDRGFFFHQLGLLPILLHTRLQPPNVICAPFLCNRGFTSDAALTREAIE